MTRRLTPRMILLVGWLVFVIAAYPGYLDEAGADMLSDVHSGYFTDWHSPVLTQLWSWVEYLIGGPAGMFVLQGTAIQLGAHAILRGVMSPRAAAVLASGLLLFPPVIATASLVCVDSTFAALLLVGFVWLRRPSRCVRGAGMAAFLAAVALRPLSALVPLPLLVLSLPLADGKKRVALAIVAIAAFVGLGLAANHLIPATSSNPRPAPAHRLRAFERELGINPGKTWRPTYTRFLPGDVAEAVSHNAARSRLQKILEKGIRLSGETPLFWPLLYVAIAIVVGVLALRRRDWLRIALVTSGLLAEVSLYWTNDRARFEHSHWMIVTALLAGVLTLRRFRRTEQQVEQPGPLPLAESPSPASAA